MLICRRRPRTRMCKTEATPRRGAGALPPGQHGAHPHLTLDGRWGPPQIKINFFRI
jgi:hypothetical protein